MDRDTYRIRRSPVDEREDIPVFPFPDSPEDCDSVQCNTSDSLPSRYLHHELIGEGSPVTKLAEQFSKLKLSDESADNLNYSPFLTLSNTEDLTDNRPSETYDATSLQNDQSNADGDISTKLDQVVGTTKDCGQLCNDVDDSNNNNGVDTESLKSTSSVISAMIISKSTNVDGNLNEDPKIVEGLNSTNTQVEKHSETEAITGQGENAEQNVEDKLSDSEHVCDIVAKSSDSEHVCDIVEKLTMCEVVDGANCESDIVKKGDVNVCDKNITPKFYGVALLKGASYHKGEEGPLVYEELKEALKATKRYPGARFKEFTTKADACAFASQNVIEVPRSSCSEDSFMSYTIPLKSVSSQDLMKLKQSIEQGALDNFKAAVEQNAKLLVGKGDNPTVMQEGFRYNALHIAARSKKPEMCQAILDTINDPYFYDIIFCEDSMPMRKKRIKHIVDLYLNTPDKRIGETPLHFASKFGCLNCVKVLLSDPICDPSRRNTDNMTAAEIICSRLYPPPEDLVKDMQKAFGDSMYVPILRVSNNASPPRIGKPCHRSEIVISTSNKLITQQAPEDFVPAHKLMAFAGPMAPEVAERFYNVWKNPSSPSHGSYCPEERMLVSHIRLADTEKGLERVGRLIAQDLKVSWSEYWPALNAFADLSTAEGLLELDHCLERESRQINSDLVWNNLAASIARNRLKNLPEITLEESIENSFTTPPSSPDESTFFTPPDSPAPSVDPFEGCEVFVEGKTFTRLDVDMLLAIEARGVVDFGKYPHVAQWRHLVKSKLKSMIDADQCKQMTPLPTVSVPRIQQSVCKDLRRKLFNE